MNSDEARTTPGGEPKHHMGKMSMLKDMPSGLKSPSGHYWCAMCKKMFQMDDPVCPYMPTMCVNTPIAVETLPPGSTAFYERVGLFYPKIVQPLLAEAVRQSAEPEKLGRLFADDYLADLAEWHVEHQSSPVEAIKSFLIYTSGFDVAARTSEAGFTLYLMDAQSIWGEDMPAKMRSKAALLAGARRVAEAIGLSIPIDLHFMSVTSGKMGRYYCAQCSMFFEYGSPQSQVTCPFMPQKCKFRPRPTGDVIAETPDQVAAFDVDQLVKIFSVSPKLYRRQLSSALASAPDREAFVAAARESLLQGLRDWGFGVAEPKKLAALYSQLGLF
jgi:hypothetical protein